MVPPTLVEPNKTFLTCHRKKSGNETNVALEQQELTGNVGLTHSNDSNSLYRTAQIPVQLNIYMYKYTSVSNNNILTFYRIRSAYYIRHIHYTSI